nr:AAA family ATPase [Alteromonas stellipolaris]
MDVILKGLFVVKIHIVEIKKFRSIDRAEIRFDDITAIVGENNSGKSAIIQALSTFFNYDDKETTKFNDGTHSYTPKSKAVITITFIGVPAGSKIKQYETNNQLIVQFSHTKRGKKPIIKYKKNNTFIEATDVLISLIKQHINFVYIPPIRTASDLQYTETAILRQLVEAHLDGETRFKDSFTNKFKDAFAFLQKNALSKLSKKLNKESSLPDGLGLQLGFRTNMHYSEYVSDIEVSVLERSLSHNLLNCGTGIQSLTVISLYRLLAKLEERNIFLALEEPETNLHPHAQREFISALKKDANNSQIALTTHSTAIIDTLGHKDVMLVKKTPDSTRGFKSHIEQLPMTFFEDHGLNSFKYYQFHLYRNSEFFYARKVIIVESKTDAEIVKVLATSAGLDIALSGCSIISLDGVKNLTYPISIIKALKLSYLVIVDKDFFVPYLNNNDPATSRDNLGFPLYGEQFKNSSPIELLIPDPTDREKIRVNINSNHTKTLELMDAYDLITMRFNLETDLLQSRGAVELICDELSLEGVDRTASKILSEKRYRKRIKNIELLINVVSKLEASSLPRSYSRIRRKLISFCS